MSIHPVTLLGAVFVAMFWLVSLRRTPYAFAWFCVAVVLATGAVVTGQAMMSTHISIWGNTHISIWGVAGVQMAFAAIAGFTAMCTEFTATATATAQGEISRWRREHPKTTVPTIPQPRFLRSEESRKWTVQTGLPDKEGKVPVYIRMGDAKQEIGRENPIENMEEFLNLKTKASDAASQYNVLKIGWEPKSKRKK